MRSAPAEPPPGRARPRGTGRPPRWAAGLCVLGGLVLLVVLLVAPGDGAAPPRPEDPAPAAPDPSPGPSPGPVAVDAALGTLQRALRRGEAAGTTPPLPGPVAAIVANAADLGLRDLTVRRVGPVRTGPSRLTTATARVTWRLPGAPRSRSLVSATVHPTDGLVALGAAEGARPLWLTARVRVRSTSATRVLTAPGVPAGRYARWARDAVATVRAVLPARPRLLVLEVVRDASGLDAALGAAPGATDGIAAVTTSAGGPTRVVVDHALVGRLRPPGAAVVIAHEAVHVATGVSSGPGRGSGRDTAPLWFQEGFADWVALREVDLPLRTTAAQVRERVRRDAPPRALPTDADLAPGATGLGASYEAAWVACVVLADRAGPDGLVRLQGLLGSGRDWPSALRASTGWSEQDLLEAWRARLRRLAA